VKAPRRGGRAKTRRVTASDDDDDDDDDRVMTQADYESKTGREKLVRFLAGGQALGGGK